MTLSPSSPADSPIQTNYRTRWFHLLLLGGLVVSGVILRLHKLTADGLYVDEYWSVYLATGRGDAIFNMPQGELIPSPPRATFVGAPHIWHIWTGLDTIIHPPLYYLVLRAWADVFGQSDFSVRFLTVVTSLACIILLFDVVRRFHSPPVALIAAAFMTFAPIQITLSQQARPYPMMIFLGLLLAEILFFIQRNGAGRFIACALAVLVAALALTHYFVIGVIAASMLYAIIRLRGQPRRRVIAAYISAAIFVAVAWGPILISNYSHAIGIKNFCIFPNRSLVRSILNIPERITLGSTVPLVLLTFLLSLIFGTVGNIEWTVFLPMDLLIYISPIFRWRRNPELLLWWLWALFSILTVAILDVSKHSVMLSVDKYIFLLAPAVYAMLALPLPTRVGWLFPLVILTGTITYSIQQWQTPVQPWEEHARAGASLVQAHVHPGELVMLCGGYPPQPQFEYFYIAHYRGEWQNPIILTSAAQPPDWTGLASILAKYPHFWVFTSPQAAGIDLPPTWRVLEGYSLEGNNLLLIAP